MKKENKSFNSFEAPPPPPPTSHGSISSGIGSVSSGIGSVGSGMGSSANSGSASSGSDLSLNLRSGSKTTSAPSSPAKSRESLLQRVQSLTGQARDQGASIIGEFSTWFQIIDRSIQNKRYITLLSEIKTKKYRVLKAPSRKFDQFIY